MTSRAAIFLTALLLGGCAAPPKAPSESRLDAQRIHLDLVRGMLVQRQYYAALAHIQEQRNQGHDQNDLRLLEAEALRKLKRFPDAERVYKQLLTTTLSAEAHHGLGLLYSGRDLNQSIAHLRRAVQKRPAAATMRNDLGYALMLARRYPEALPELATATELAPDQMQNTNNLIVLLVLMKDEAAVRRVAADAGIRNDRLAELRLQAQDMERPDASKASRKVTSKSKG